MSAWEEFLPHSRKDFEQRVKNQVDYDALSAQEKGTVVAPVGTPDNPSHQILTVANVITFARLGLTIVFLVMFVNHEKRYLAIALYAVAAITDFLDGQVARRTQTVSWLGKVMDPIMDRVLLFTGVLGLVVTGELPLWVAVVVIGRDIYLAIGEMLLQRYRRRPVDVLYSGKTATFLLMAGFCDLLLGLPRVGGFGWVGVDWLPGLNSEPAALGMFAVYVGLVFSIVTAVRYTLIGVGIRRTAIEARERGEEA